MKNELSDTNQANGECMCGSIVQKAQLSLGDEDVIRASLSEIAKQTPWLTLSQCQVCNCYWYVAVDTVNDEVYFWKLQPSDAIPIQQGGKWPTVFDWLKWVWPENEQPVQKLPASGSPWFMWNN